MMKRFIKFNDRKNIDDLSDIYFILIYLYRILHFNISIHFLFSTKQHVQFNDIFVKKIIK